MALQKPGFRFYPTDVLLFAMSAALTYGFSCFEFTHAFYMMPVYVILSFFMFCNVLRIGTTLEAIFALGVIISHTLMYVRSGDTFNMYMLMLPGILVVTVVSICLGWYRGIFWKTFSRISNRMPEQIENMPISVLKKRDFVTYLFFAGK